MVHEGKLLPVKNLEIRVGLPLDRVQLNPYTINFGVPAHIGNEKVAGCPILARSLRKGGGFHGGSPLGLLHAPAD